MCSYEPGLHRMNKFLIWVQSWRGLRIHVSISPRLEWIWGHFGVKELDLLAASSLLMSLFCSRWFPGDMWWLSRLRPTVSSVVQRSSSKLKRSYCYERPLAALISPCVRWEKAVCSYLWESVHQSAPGLLLWDAVCALCGHRCVSCMWKGWHVLLRSSVGVNMYDGCNVNIREEVKNVSV